MTTLAELVAATPAATRGVLTSYVHGTGTWRFVVELADPAAGSAVQWYDITAINDPRVWTGYEYTRGSDSYLGRYRASIVNLDLFTGDDSLAPWNPDTSGTFGVHVELGPGLLIRAGFIRVNGGVTVEWNPRFTNKVQYWGDASYSKGQVRLHRITARDMMSSLVGVPLPARPEENWSDRMYNFLVNSGWPYGSAIYGAQFASGGAPILTLPARAAQTSAMQELDATLDPVGLVWYTNRLGQLVVRPRVDDTFHAAAFAAGATGDQWPGDVTPVDFTWWACQGDEGESESDAAAYAMDFDAVAPFGFDKDEANIVNHVVVTAGPDIYDDDDPISIQRYDRKALQSSWQAPNHVVAAQILETRRNAVNVARPLHTTDQLEGFFPGPARVDYLGYVAIDHRNNDFGQTAFGNGWLRYYREKVVPRGCDIDWSLTLTVDVFNITATASMLPVTNLHIVGVTDWAAEFGWDNPVQTVIPTHTQYRLFSGSTTPWLTAAYPGEVADASLWTGLAPETTYQFQVRLIRIEDGLITAFSPSRSINVTTDATVLPHVDVDEDGDVTGDPGTIGVGCESAVEVQVLTPPDTWTTVPGYGDTLLPGETYSFDSTSLPDGVYRLRFLEICDDIPDPDGWYNDDPFTNVCADPDRLSDAPYDEPSLVAYIPQVCGKVIEEAVSNVAVTMGDAYLGTGHDSSGDFVLRSSHQGVIGYGAEPNPVPASSDLTIACRVKISTAPTSETILWGFGGALISIVASGAGYRLRTHVIEAPNTDHVLLGSTVLALGSVYHLALRHDVSAGTVRIYVNTVEDGSTLGGVGTRLDPFGYSIRLPANSWGTDYAVWDEALAPSNLPGHGGPTVTINQHPTQADPASASPILFAVHFSEAVTGFGTSDVTLSGTAGATTVAVSGAGADYTVSVSGMTTSGTVIATIPAAVASAVGGLPNVASTSTDNTVTYSATPLIGWTHYWDMSHTAKWTGTEQQPEIGPLNLKTLDFAPDYTGQTINGLQCIANIGGFVSVRREFGTDAALPALTGPYGIGIVYRRHTEDAGTAYGNDGHMVALATTASPGPHTPYIASGDPGPTDLTPPTAGVSTTLTAVNSRASLNTTHVAFLYCDGANSRLYIDGVLEQAGTIGGSDQPINRRMVWITNRASDATGPASGAGSTYSKAGEGGLAQGVISEAAILAWEEAMRIKWGGVTGVPSLKVTVTAQTEDPTHVSPVEFQVVFSEAVTGFTAADVNLTASTAPGSLAATVTGSGSTYIVKVGGMSGGGTVVVTIPTGVVTSVATGRTNVGSTSTDNSVLYAASGMVPFFDPFARPDYGAAGGNVDGLGADWSQAVAVGGGTFYYGVVSDQMRRLGTSGFNAITKIAAAQHTLPGPNITLEFDLVANPGIFINLYVYNRYNFTTNTGYRLTFNNNGGGGVHFFFELEKIVAGVVTSLGTVTLTNEGSGSATPLYPQRWRFACIGSTITVHSLPFIGGTPVLRMTRTDSGVTVGSGVGFQGYSNTNANVQIIDNVGIT